MMTLGGCSKWSCHWSKPKKVGCSIVVKCDFFLFCLFSKLLLYQNHQNGETISKDIVSQIQAWCYSDRFYPIIIGIERLLRLPARGSVTGGVCVKLSFKEAAVNNLSIGHNVVGFIDGERGLNNPENEIKRQEIFNSACPATCPPWYYQLSPGLLS